MRTSRDILETIYIPKYYKQTIAQHAE